MKAVAISNKIYEIRGRKVMLDYDLAELYAVETKVLNQAVKRNLFRFPEDFMFRLNAEEWETLRFERHLPNQPQTGNWSQIVTSSKKHRGLRYLPNAFTEYGIAMLAGMLKSDTAVQMNIAIIRAFVELRKRVLQYNELTGELAQLKQEVQQRLSEHDTQLAAIYDAIENLLDEKAGQLSWEERARIGYK